jgi:hypothetical protein
MLSDASASNTQYSRGGACPALELELAPALELAPTQEKLQTNPDLCAYGTYRTYWSKVLSALM